MPRLAALLAAVALTAAACSDADGNVGLRTSDDNEQAEIGEVEAPQVIGGEDGDDASGDEALNVSDADSDGEGGEQGSIDAGGTEQDSTGDADSTETSTQTDPGTGGGTPTPGSNPDDVDDENEQPTQPETPTQPPLDPDDEPEGDVDDDPAAEGRIDVSYPSAPVTNLGSGEEVDLAGELADRDKRTLLWFWQPGNGPSAAEADVVARLQAELGDDIDVVAVGTGGDLATAQAFAADAGLAGVTILWDGSAEAVEYYEVGQLPSSILLDFNGDIIGRWNTLSPEVFQLVQILS